VQIHDQRNVFGKKFVAGGALVEIERLAAPQDGDARHFDIHARRVKENAGAPGGGEDAAQLGSPPAKAVLTSGDVAIVSAMPRASASFFAFAHFDFDDRLRAFAVSHDLQRERTADFFKGGSERTLRRRARFDRRRTRSPLARTSNVSFVEVSPSTLIALNVRPVTSCSVFAGAKEQSPHP